MQRSNIETLTTARAIFAWWVVLYHGREWTGSEPGNIASIIIDLGYLGVDFFFVLSGFVIHHSNGRHFQQLSQEGYANFMKRRYLKILPLHIFVLLCMVAIPIATKFFSKSQSISDYYSSDYFLLSLFLIQNWGNTNELKWNAPAWSVSCEHLAYLAYPLLARFGLLKIKKYNFAFIFLAAALINISLAILFELHSAKNIGDRIESLGALRCLGEFTIGALAAEAYKEINLRNAVRAKFSAFHVNIVAMSIFIIASTVLIAAPTEMRPPNYFYIPLLTGFLILTISLNRTEQTSSPFATLLQLGEASYATYICHFPIKIALILLDYPEKNGPEITFLTYIATTALCTWLLTKGIELPIQSRIARTALFTPAQPSKRY
jgi:peptidoglycan/LPS O-acetylase OafA/YrhL